MEDEELIKEDYSNECGFLAKVDRAISSYYSINVIDENSGKTESIGYTDITEKKIWINFNKIKNKSETLVDFISMFKGVNYHELSHIMFTNISFTNIEIHCQRLKKTLKYSQLTNEQFIEWVDKSKNVLNLLEDIKIENYFSTRFPKSKDYFVLLVNNFIVNNEQIFPEIFLLLYGRKAFYYDTDIISNFEILFKQKYGDYKTQECKKICDEYIKATEVKQQSHLIFSLAHIINFPIDKSPTTSNKSSSFTKKQLKKNNQLIEMSSENNNNKKVDIDKNTQEIEDNYMNKNNSSGSNSSRISQEVKQQIETKLKEDVIKNTKDIKESLSEDIDKDIKVLYNKKNLYNTADLSHKLSGYIVPFKPDENSIINSKKLKRFMRVLNTDLKSDNKRYQKSGRIDIKSILKSMNTGSVRLFKKFKTDKRDQTKLAVSILLDGSGSVNYKVWDKQVEASWIITTALESLGNKVMITEFSNNWKLKKGFYTKTNWKRHFDGGTYPYEAIENSLKCFKSIKNKENIHNHLLIILTDGGWFEEKKNDGLIKEVNKYGIHTVLINCCGFEGGNHNCQEVINVKDMNDLPFQLKEVIKRIKIKLVKKIK